MLSLRRTTVGDKEGSKIGIRLEKQEMGTSEMNFRDRSQIGIKNGGIRDEARAGELLVETIQYPRKAFNPTSR
jgi:hypothetical protein